MLLAESSREEFHRVSGRPGCPGAAQFPAPAVPAPGPRSPAPAGGPTAPNSPSKSRAHWYPPRQARPTPESSVVLSVRDAGHRNARPAADRVQTARPRDIRPVPAGHGAGSFPAAGGAGQTPGGDVLRRRAPGAPATPLAAGAAPAAFAGHDDELKAVSLRDPLTALPNGPFFNERLAAALRRPDPVDILLLNIDDFKHLNDMLGRSAADELLVEVASRLRNCVRPHDTVARLGGDEFAVLLTECLNADAVAKRIAEALYEPLRVGGTMVRPGREHGPGVQVGADAGRRGTAAAVRRRHDRGQGRREEPVAAVPAGDAEHRGAQGRRRNRAPARRRTGPDLGALPARGVPGRRLGGAVRGVRAVGTARPAGPAQPVPARGRAERPDPRDRRRGPAPRLRRDPALAGRRRRLQRRRERLGPAVPAPRLRRGRARDCGLHRRGPAPADA